MPVSQHVYGTRGIGMQSFWQALKTQRWDDHRYYHHSRINQSLHLVSALSFLASYAVVWRSPTTRRHARAGWSPW